MRFHKRILPALGILFLLGVSCQKEAPPVPSMTLLTAAVNGQKLEDGAKNVAIKPTIELTFSGALDPGKFLTACSITAASGKVPLQFSYVNAGSKAVLTMDSLEYNTGYQLQVAAQAIGKNGESLDKPLSLSFTTMEKGLIMEMAPCVSAGGECMQTVTLPGGGRFSFYASFPLFLEDARWKNLQHAVLVLHGQNRDADLYYSYLTTALKQGSFQDNTILIAPDFKNSSEAQAGEWYWTSTSWRDGQSSLTPGLASVSSFGVIDQLVERLADKEHFPAMRNILITGHSSGGLFVQLYAAANSLEAKYSGLKFSYGAANTQYYYYPDDMRFDEGKGQFVQPANCPTFNHWPMGFVNRPAYVNTISKDTLNARLLQRNIAYLLGNGTGADPTLNTTDCEATWLGSSRFKRGEHVFQWLETRYAGVHKSQKVVVQGVGHDGQGMYLSQEVNAWIKNKLK
jgi:hypothetical protein